MGLAAADPRAEARAHDALARILEAAGQLDQAEEVCVGRMAELGVNT